MNDNSNDQPSLSNVEEEQLVIGAILLDNDAFYHVSSILSTEHFYDPVHQSIWEHIKFRLANDMLASPITLRSDMSEHAGLRELGGPGYLLRMAGSAPSSRFVKDYAKDIIANFQRRELNTVLTAAMEDLKHQEGLDNAKSRLENVLAVLPSSDGRANTKSFLSAMTGAIDQINNAYMGNSGALKTGLDAWDAKTGGLYKQDFIVLGGRPSMGKTALAASMAKRIAAAGGKVVIASLEMTEESLALRILAEETGLNYSDMRRGEITEPQFRRIVEKAKGIMDLPIGFVPPHVKDIISIQSAVKSERARLGGLDAVFIDYLQLVNGPGRGRYEIMSEVSRQTKAMARALDVPVVALSQLSRNVEQREDKRPVLSDLRETGQIEQDADVVAFCYRHEYYLQRAEAPQDANEQADYYAAIDRHKNTMDVIVQKQRMGEIFSGKIGCHIPSNRFWNLSQQESIEI